MTTFVEDIAFKPSAGNLGTAGQTAAADNGPEASPQAIGSVTDEELAAHKSTRLMREDYANRAWEIVTCSVRFWMGLLMFAGFAAFYGHQFLSDHVLMAITAGVTVNIFAILSCVIKGLFPSSKSISK